MSAAQNDFDLLSRNQDKRASHPEDEHTNTDEELEDTGVNDEKQHYSTDDRDPDDSGSDRAAMPSSTRGYKLPTMHYSANTGPKGVIADAQSFEKAKHSSWRQRRKSSARRDVSQDEFARELTRSASRPNIKKGDLSSEDDEEDFMREWRKHRLRELQSYDPRARRQSPSKRKYGKVEAVDASGYLDAVEKVGSETIVVVAIYDDESPVSRLVEDSLTTIAQKHYETRFVKLHYVEAEMDIASVPAILAYKAGELFANLVSVIDEIPPNRNLSSSSLELVFKQHRILV